MRALGGVLFCLLLGSNSRRMQLSAHVGRSMPALRPCCDSPSSKIFRMLRSISMKTSKERLEEARKDAQRLGNEMKAAEVDTCDAAVDMNRPVVIRLDGHCFHTYTRDFDRPYDVRLHRAMVATTTDLLTKFQASTAYTESDEISLLFAPNSADALSNIPFNGRVQKLVSVFAGYASARFNMHMLRESFDDSIPEQAALRERVERSDAHFDARAFNLPSVDRLAAYMRWRAVLDCQRNSVSMLSQFHFHHSELQGVDTRACIRMLDERKRVKWEETPAWFRYGTFVKKEEYTKAGVNPKTKEKVMARRTRSSARSFRFDESTAHDFLLTSVWPPNETSTSNGNQ